MTRLLLARACRLIARLSLGHAEWWARMAERIERKPGDDDTRGIGA